MKAVKIALCGVLAVAAVLAAVRSIDADTVDLWIIHDVRPWLTWDGSTPPDTVGADLRVVRK